MLRGATSSDLQRSWSKAKKSGEGAYNMFNTNVYMYVYVQTYIHIIFHVTYCNTSGWDFRVPNLKMQQTLRFLDSGVGGRGALQVLSIPYELPKQHEQVQTGLRPEEKLREFCPQQTHTHK